MAFRKVLFVTIAEAEKRQLDRGSPGAFWTVCLHVCHTAEGWRALTDRLKQPTAKCWPFPPAVSDSHPLHLPKTPKWESQYEVMECILNWFRWLETETVSSLFPQTSSNPLSLLSLLSIPLLRACDLWSKASRQQRCRLWVRREGERWEKKVREHAPPMSFQPRLLSETLQSGCWDWINSSFLSSNTQFTGSISNGGTGWSQPRSNEGAVSAFFCLGNYYVKYRHGHGRRQSQRRKFEGEKTYHKLSRQWNPMHSSLFSTWVVLTWRQRRSATFSLLQFPNVTSFVLQFLSYCCMQFLLA